ncbi:hypothetical protein [Halobacillus litoralis]|uniref:hypothetical protein n=1 Tax=Halobacillus litoralis TaxID=45668 RepID=UPI002490792B|nr:hypothetical protein [Halobacillus litoralis]
MEQKEFFEDRKLKWSLSRMGLLVLSVSTASVLLNEHVLQGSIPFLFDYVFTAFVGYAIGKSHVALSNRTFPYLEDMSNLGTLSLYAFICVTIYEAAQVGFDSFRPIFFILILTKTLVIGLMTIGIVLVALKKMKKEEKMISIVAGWTLLLNAPVTCMHGMRSVTSKLGPVPQVLLIVPPVVLWLINYVQWGIHSFL